MNLSSLTFFFLLQALWVSPLMSQERTVQLRDFEAVFDQHLANPAQYSKKVNQECRDFPEGALFPYSMVALAWCHQIYRTPSRAGAILPKVENWLRLALKSSERVIQPSGGDFMKLSSAAPHGTYVSQLAMALSAYRLAGGTDGYLVKVGDRFNGLLVAEVSARKGNPIESSPGIVWPFDTSTALFAIELHDRATGSSNAGTLLKQHRNWILASGIDSASGLPASQVLSGGRLVPTRGCDLSWRIAFWSEMNSSQSDQWYRSYHNQFWKYSAMAKGFQEWKSEKVKRMDLDSGPILKGLGTTATALGLCAALAHSDKSSADALVAQAGALATARKKTDFISRVKVKTIDSALNNLGIATSGEYLTGFLYGDATAFYAMSWHKYPRSRIQ